MVVAADGVAVNQVAVQVKQLHVTLAHTAPASATQISLMKEYNTYSYTCIQGDNNT